MKMTLMKLLKMTWMIQMRRSWMIPLMRKMKITKIPMIPMSTRLKPTTQMMKIRSCDLLLKSVRQKLVKSAIKLTTPKPNFEFTKG